VKGTPYRLEHDVPWPPEEGNPERRMKRDIAILGRRPEDAFSRCEIAGCNVVGHKCGMSRAGRVQLAGAFAMMIDAEAKAKRRRRRKPSHYHDHPPQFEYNDSGWNRTQAFSRTTREPFLTRTIG